jgi:hypothetical protein
VKDKMCAQICRIREYATIAYGMRASGWMDGAQVTLKFGPLPEDRNIRGGGAGWVDAGVTLLYKFE